MAGVSTTGGARSRVFALDGTRVRPSSERLLHELAGAPEQPVAAVERRIPDDVVEQPVERAAELRARLVADRDQVVAVDLEVGQAVRARALRLEHGAEARQRRQVV